MSDIMMDGKNVGTVTIEKEGLYYRFFCRCHFEDKAVHSIWVFWEGGSRKLGVCIPEGKYACLNTKVPIKYIPSTELTFKIDHRENDGFYPIDPGQPFPHMDKLTKARFATLDGKPGLVIK